MSCVLLSGGGFQVVYPLACDPGHPELSKSNMYHSPDASMLARFSLPAWSSVRAWLLRLRAVFDFAPAHLPAADPVLHMSTPVRRGAVADARLGLA